jgi:hypothetical protein
VNVRASDASVRRWPGFLARVVPTIAYTLAILVGGSWPTTPGKPGVNDKVLHAVVFGFLVPVAFGAVSYYRRGSAWGRSLLLALLYSVTLGGLLELWQGLLKYRSRELLDWVADGAGALVAALCVAACVSAWRARGSRECA